MVTIKAIIAIILDILLAFLIRNRGELQKLFSLKKRRKKWANKPKIKLFKKKDEV